MSTNEDSYKSFENLYCDNITKALYTALPVLHGSPTETSNLYTALKIAQGISMRIAPDGKTVVTLYLQL